MTNFKEKSKMRIISYLFRSNKKRIEDFNHRGAVIIDVRTHLEWDAGHLANALHIPISNLKDHVDAIKKMNKPIIVYCKSGVRSARGAKLLKFYKIEAINGGGIVNLQRFIN